MITGQRLISGDLNRYIPITLSFNLLPTDSKKYVQLKKNNVIIKTLTIELILGTKVGSNWWIDNSIMLATGIIDWVIVAEYRNNILTFTTFNNGYSSSISSVLINLEVDTITII